MVRQEDTLAESALCVVRRESILVSLILLFFDLLRRFCHLNVA